MKLRSMNVAPPRGPFTSIVGMESQEDFRLLFRLAKILHRTDHSLPDLQKHAKAGEVMCIPFGLPDPRGFVELFLNLDLPQLYLFSRGSGPMPEARRELIRRIRQEVDCSAVILRKRAMTNYLHPDAIYEEFRAPVKVDDDTDVPVAVLQHVLKHLKFPAWDQLDPQLRADMAAAMAYELSVKASRRMTAERLTQRDPNGEVAGWLRSIGKYLR
jgi:hypothetical protein